MIITPARLASVLILTLSACSDDADPSGAPDGGAETPATVVELARESGDFSVLLGALEATGLDEALAAAGPFTVFAPTDAAFARLPAGVVEGLDADTLSRILRYHVVAGDVRAADVAGLTTATMLSDDAIAIEAGAAGVFLNGGTQVTTTDLLADNGVVHVVDSVLLPQDAAFPGTVVETLAAYPRFATLVSAVSSADLAGALSTDNGGDGFTVFAPTEQAFAELGVDLGSLAPEALAEILTYHVVGGTVDAATVVGLDEAATLQGASISIEVVDGVVVLDETSAVTYVDRRASNGIVHVIDGVLSPPQP